MVGKTTGDLNIFDNGNTFNRTFAVKSNLVRDFLLLLLVVVMISNILNYEKNEKYSLNKILSTVLNRNTTVFNMYAYACTLCMTSS